MKTTESETAAYTAEENLLGAVMIQSSFGDKTAIEAVSLILETIDFEGCFLKDKPYIWPPHARVYYAMLYCENSPHQVNVALQMDKLGILRLEDCAHLAYYIRMTPCSLDYLDYANAVKEYSTMRQVKYHADKGNFEKLNQILNKNQNKPLGTVPL